MAGTVALAQRFSDLWATGPVAMVAELYSSDAISEDLTDPSSRVVGIEPRQEVEARLFTRIPNHTIEVLAILELDDRAVLECLVRGSSSVDPCPMATPALLWWQLDAEGGIAREQAWLRWDARRPDDGLDDLWARSPRPQILTTAAPDADDEVRSQTFYRTLAEHLAGSWSWDPVLADQALYDEDCVIESALRPGAGLRGRAALEAADAALALRLPRPDRRMTVLDVIGQGRTLAMRISLEGREAGQGPQLRTHGALVLTLDGSDRVTSSRAYLDWDRAVPVADEATDEAQDAAAP